MQLFNSLSQQIETFVAHNDEVKLYVCGITPYDTAHLGHAFVFTTFDILVRYLRSQGLRVVYVENVTDIDDPLFEKARELGDISWDQLARQETERFVREMHAINVVMPDHFVRASEQLSTMFSLIERLLQSGNAYLNDGWIYFDVRSDAQFAQLAFASGLMGYDQLLESAIRWIFSSGGALSLVSQPGRAPGVQDGQAGILNVRPQRRVSSGRKSISMAGEQI